MTYEATRTGTRRRTACWRAALLGIAFVVQGCGSVSAARPACFSDRPEVQLPKPDAHAGRLTNGQSGRDLALAVHAGSVDDAVARLRADPRLADTHIPPVPYPDFAPDGAYGNLLTFAVGRCDPGMIDALLAAGVSPDAGQPGEAMSLALLADTPEMADRLLRGGAMTNPETKGGRSHVNDMAVIGNLGGLRLLDRYGAKLDVPDGTGVTPLRTALAQNYVEAARMLHDRGASLWSVDVHGEMPLHKVPSGSDALDDGTRNALAPLIAERERVGNRLPDPETVRDLIVDGRWPTPDLRPLGAHVPSDAVVAIMRSNRDRERARGIAGT